MCACEVNALPIGPQAVDPRRIGIDVVDLAQRRAFETATAAQITLPADGQCHSDSRLPRCGSGASPRAREHRGQAWARMARWSHRVAKAERLRYKLPLMTAKPRPGFALADRDDALRPPGQLSIVSSHNEWDPLEEVVVGVLEGAAIPDLHFSYEASLPESSVPMFRGRGGHRFEEIEFAHAVRELEAFVRRLESEGVVVKRPDPVDHGKPFSTPSWQSSSGLYSAMPRDLLIVVGDQLIEAPLAWRCRYFEIEAYRSLLKSYFKLGAQWIAAPRPTLRDEHFHEAYSVERGEWVTTEYEPTFDAADFARFGEDIFVQRSHVTNRFGIDWFARHIGPRYRVHEIAINDPHAMHIDATLVPLRPGTVAAVTNSGRPSVENLSSMQLN